MYRFGLIGAGNMGSAIINGAVNCSVFKASEVLVFDLSEEKLNDCKKRGYSLAKSEQEVIENSELVLFAIKPQGFESLLNKLKLVKNRDKNQIIITIAAGVSTSYIQQYLGTDTKLIRVMPNTPLMIGCGACAFSKTENVSDAELEKIMSIFKHMGEVVIIDEKDMNNVIPANGSAPAFVYYFINGITKSVAETGIDKEVAKKLVAQTFIGAAKMMLQSDKDADELIKAVCSPGGTTIETIKVFDEKNMYGIIDEGCKKCIKRAYELNN